MSEKIAPLINHGSVPPATLPELFAAARPAASAFLLRCPDGTSFTYAEADVITDRIASVLFAEGVRAGDRVAMQIEKSPTAVWLWLACLRIGAVLLPMNPQYTGDEVSYLLQDGNPSLVIADPAAAGARLADRVLTCSAEESGSLYEAVSGVSIDFEKHRSRPSDPALLLYTSGTTGRPKGALLSQSNLASNAATLVQAWGFTQDDVTMHVLPIFHIHGLVNGFNCIIGSGSQLLFFSRFDPAQVISAFDQATVFMGVPTHYHRILSEPNLDEPSCASMRLFVSGSAPLLPQVFAEFKQRSGHTILERYGMTETLMITSNPLVGDRRPGTVGPPLPGIDVRVVDDETGAPMATGEIGAIEVRGPNVFAGYFGRPELNAVEFCEDGFFKTGDLGAFDDDGYLTIVGRSKDLVISGGMNVYPKEVEEALDALAGIKESAVVGIADPDFGEVAVAAIVIEGGRSIDLEECRRQVRQQLAPYKVPKQIVVFEDLPRNAMGKVEKSVIRQRLTALVNLETKSDY